MKKIIIVFIFVIIFFVLYTDSIFAGLAVDPTITEISIARDEIYQGTYTVINTGDEELIVNIEPEDWLKRYLKKENTVDVSKWLVLEETSFTLAPAAMKEINYSVSIPPEMEEEQAAQIFYSFSKKAIDSKSFRTRLGVIMYLAIKGKEHLKAEIEELNIQAKKSGKGTYDLVSYIKINNTGNIHIRPYGVVRIMKYGKRVALIEIKKGKGIYPRISDVVSGTATNVELKPGGYKAEAEMYCTMYGIEKKISKKINFTI